MSATISNSENKIFADILNVTTFETEIQIFPLRVAIGIDFCLLIILREYQYY